MTGGVSATRTFPWCSACAAARRRSSRLGGGPHAGLLAGAAALGLLLLLPAISPAEDFVVVDLAMEGKLQISLVDAVRIERRLGQLLMVNVDGFGVVGPLAVSSDYLELLGDLQVGAVIPHYGRCSPSVIRVTNDALSGRTSVPLLICSDIVTLCAADGTRASFGDGYVGGFIGRYRGLDDRAFGRLAYLNAFVLRALGMNCALWPTVDASTGEERVVERAGLVMDELARFGLLTTVKHWPFVPQGVDLHRESVDSALRLGEVALLTAPFRVLSGGADLLMTTHVFDSLVDDSLVTLSSRWLEILRGDARFSGPLVTDGLFMLRSHRDRAGSGLPLPGLGSSTGDEIAAWAARAILAGHDMVILEGDAATSRHVFERILEIACRGDDLGSRMRARILAAHAGILALKERRAADLAAGIDPPEGLVDRVVRLAAGGAEGLGDGAAFGAIEKEIAATCGRLPSWKGGR